MKVTKQNFQKWKKSNTTIFVCKPFDVKSLTCRKLGFTTECYERMVKTGSILLSSIFVLEFWEPDFGEGGSDVGQKTG